MKDYYIRHYRGKKYYLPSPSIMIYKEFNNYKNTFLSYSNPDNPIKNLQWGVGSHDGLDWNWKWVWRKYINVYAMYWLISIGYACESLGELKGRELMRL